MGLRLISAIPAPAVASLLSACTMVGPTVGVQPGAGRTAATLAEDHRACMAETDARLRPVALRPGMGPAVVQPLYDRAYGDCMGRRGNVVAAAAPGTYPAARAVAAGGGALTTSGLRDAGSVAARQSLSHEVADSQRACEDERIDVATAEIALSPGLSARRVELSTPGGGSCFGEPGRNSYVVAQSGAGWQRLLAAEPGSITARPSSHGGMADLDLHSLGQCVYAYRWNGGRYVQAAARDCATAAPPTHAAGHDPDAAMTGPGTSRRIRPEFAVASRTPMSWRIRDRTKFTSSDAAIVFPALRPR